MLIYESAEKTLTDNDIVETFYNGSVDADVVSIALFRYKHGNKTIQDAWLEIMNEIRKKD